MDFHKLDIWVLSETRSRNFKFYEHKTRTTGTLHKDQYTFSITSHSTLRTSRNVSDKSCRKTQNTYLIFSNFLRKSCRLWDNVEKYCTAEVTVDNMAHAHSMLDNAHSEYVILITFPLQQQLQERSSMSRYTYLSLRYTYLSWDRIIPWLLSTVSFSHTPIVPKRL
jgi:hypothetical protein